MTIALVSMAMAIRVDSLARRSLGTASVLCAFFWGGGACVSRQGAEPPSAEATPATSTASMEFARPAVNPEPARSPVTPRYRLVVAVVIDQLGAEPLKRFSSLLSPGGGLRRALDEGLVFERGRYPYAGTLTAPGHATLFTGAPPSQSGVSANKHWDYAKNSARSAVEDPEARVLGSSEQLGPAALRVQTVGEALERATQGKAQVVSLSLKDRGAIFSAGKAGTALWFDSKQGRFTTSTAYREALPAWLEAFQTAHPVERLLTPWQPLDANLYANVLGADDAPGEVNAPGFGASFPHDAAKTQSPLGILKATPQLTDYLFDLAEEAVRSEKLGQDDVPDLLAISVSGLDYTGHMFGPGSWEYLDHLRRIDRRLGAFLANVEKSTSLALLVTADHGIAPLPESPAPQGREKGQRVFPDKLKRGLERTLQARFGKGPWVAAIIDSFVYLTEKARQHPKASEVRELGKQWLSEQPGVLSALDAAPLRGQAEVQDHPLLRAVALTLGDDVDVDLYVVQEPYAVFDDGEHPGQGTHHGSPYDYDRDVPVLLMGDGISADVQPEPVDVLRVAPTLAALLGIALEQPARPLIAAGGRYMP